MAYDDVQESIDEEVHEYVNELVNEIVDELMNQARESDEFHINPEDMFNSLEVEELFADTIKFHDDDIQSVVMDSFYDHTMYDDDCIDIIKEYGFDEAIEDYYKGLELSRCSDVAYHILSDNVTAKEVEYDDHYDEIYIEFANSWKEYTVMCCMMSITDAVNLLGGHGFAKIVYEDDSVRFYRPSSGCEFKLMPDMYLVSDSVKIKLDFIRDNDYEQTLDFYSNGVMIASVEY